jgi:hypothetical protein
LLAVSIACWGGRLDTRGSAPFGLLMGVLAYDVAAAVLLAHAGLFMNLLGVLLWPAVIVHAALAVWCVMCLWDGPRDGTGPGPAHACAGTERPSPGRWPS